MAVMFVWEEDKDSWGHVSLSLIDHSDYISWYPTNDSFKNKKTDAYSKGQLPVDFKEDRNIFIGRPDTHRFVIGQHMLDTQKMKTWWKKIKTEGGYNFLFNNCCDLVVQALREGGIEIGISLIRTPAEMVRLGRELERK